MKIWRSALRLIFLGALTASCSMSAPKIDEVGPAEGGPSIPAAVESEKSEENSEVSKDGEAIEASQMQARQKEVDAIQDLFEKEDFENVLKRTKEFLDKHPGAGESPTLGYFAGVSLERLGRPEQAVEKLRSVLSLSAGRLKGLEAQALYHLGLVYETMGDQARTIAALLDAKKRDKFLSPDAADVELPARIAAAYARMGNERQAITYYAKAEKALLKYRKDFERDGPPEWYARTLYNMGKMSVARMAGADFDGAMKPIEKAQAWLIRGVELNHPIWSKRAAEELLKIYNEVWGMIENVPIETSEDKVVEAKQGQEKKWAMADRLQALIGKMRYHRIAGDNEADNSYLTDALNGVAQIENKITVLMANRPLETVKTKEMLERNSIHRRGIVVDEETTLEKEQKKEK